MEIINIVFSILGVFLVSFWAVVAYHSASVQAVEPPHAVDENVPDDDINWELIQTEPAYLRRQDKEPEQLELPL